MRRNPRLFRLTATVALSTLLWESAYPLAAMAQPAPPPIPQPDQGRPDLNQGDPPTRVGRIALMTGTVSFHNAGDTDWSAASLNYPVSSGNSFWTEPPAGVRLEISDSRIMMAGSTEFDVTTLDGTGLQGVVPQGELYVHLRDLAPNEVWSIQTPRGLVKLSGEGRYGIVVGTTDQPTLVTVIDGAAQIDGPGVSLQVAGNQTATISGTDTFQGAIGPALRDAFLTASLDSERPPPAQAVPIPAQVVAMAGGSDLVSSGSWSDAPEYGRVWYPPVAASWVPYREGHWAFVAPWGWTWIDNAPWGFAPFHYGRWIQIGGRWGWTPGAVAVAGPPVYAPALVTFIGIGAGVAVGAALASGSIGWVPLGPREPFRPWYHTSPAYVREVNITHVTNITTINNTNITINNYVNRGAATSISAAAMTSSRPVQAIARPVTAQEFAAARPIVGQQPLRPTAETVGVTQVVARQMNLAPAAAAARQAPGPAVRPVTAGAPAFVRPAFPNAKNSPVPAAAEPGRPGVVPPGTRPGAVPPAQPATPANGARVDPRPGQPGAVKPAESSETARPGGPVPPAAAVRGQPAASRPAAVPAAPRPGEGAPPAAAPRPAQPGTVRPATVLPAPRLGEVTPPAAGQPGAVRPAIVPAAPRPIAAPPPATRPVSPQVARPAPEGGAAARPELPRAAPAAPRQEPARLAPVAPRPEPPRAAPPAPRPEVRPAVPVRPEPADHKKEPGEK
jgi:hypothetical protein